MLYTDSRLPFPDRLIHLFTGLSDGLMIPLVIATAMHAAGCSSRQLLGGGLGLTVAGAVIFLIVTGLTVRNAGVPHHHDEAMLERLGISHAAGENYSDEVLQEDEVWQKQNEHSTLDVYKSHPTSIALLSGGGYLLGGLLVVLPYILPILTDRNKIVSVLLALIGLLTTGAIKANLTGQSAARGAIRLATLGMLAAAAAHYVVTLLFK